MPSIRALIIALLTLALLLAPPLRAQAHSGEGHGPAMTFGHGPDTDRHGHFQEDVDNDLDVSWQTGAPLLHYIGDHTHETGMLPGCALPAARLPQRISLALIKLPPLDNPAFLLERPPRAA